ncbi:MAG: hypothetical protein LBG27_03560 [Spirochaetaceae bacterium]|nr:hypothetical protein [Spirochaetaceae bacterium]
MTTSWLTVVDGTKLFVRKGKPADGAALQIVHGKGEHSLRYEWFAERHSSRKPRPTSTRRQRKTAW